MGYEELNSHYESLNKKSIEKYNNSYQKNYLARIIVIEY